MSDTSAQTPRTTRSAGGDTPDTSRVRAPGHAVAMITHSYYEEDSRVRREAEAVFAAGRAVDVYGLRRPGDEAEDVIDGVNVHRIDVRRHQGAGVATYLGEYAAFLVRAGWALTRAHRRRHYALVQVHTMPDFLVFAGLPVRTVGVPLLLDMHEAMPEFFPTRFPGAASPIARRAMGIQERLSIRVASHVITVNVALRDRLLGLGVKPDKVSVVPNYPSLTRFDPASVVERPFMADGILRLVYAGAVTPTYELDVAIAAVGRLLDLRPGLDVRLDVFGRGDSEPALRARVTAAGLDDRVTFRGRVPFEAVPAAIAAGDMGLAPTRLDSYTRLSLSTKVFEYGAMRRPVVATRLPLVERTFGGDKVTTYEPGDPDDLASAILKLVDDPAERDARVARTAARVADLAWEREVGHYLGIVDALAGDGRSAAAGNGPAVSAAPPTHPEDV
ncbi:MAG TPA: glycosyltransferase family 4 protein [Candidatus Limnocylindrales bacterium]